MGSYTHAYAYTHALTLIHINTYIRFFMVISSSLS